MNNALILSGAPRAVPVNKIGGTRGVPLHAIAKFHRMKTLLRSLFAFTGQFKREYKYTVGEKLNQETLDLLTLIYLPG